LSRNTQNFAHRETYDAAGGDFMGVGWKTSDRRGS
jgi:hypothetical protein